MYTVPPISLICYTALAFDKLAIEMDTAKDINTGLSTVNRL